MQPWWRNLLSHTSVIFPLRPVTRLVALSPVVWLVGWRLRVWLSVEVAPELATEWAAAAAQARDERKAAVEKVRSGSYAL